MKLMLRTIISVLAGLLLLSGCGTDYTEKKDKETGSYLGSGLISSLETQQVALDEAGENIQMQIPAFYLEWTGDIQSSLHDYENTEGENDVTVEYLQLHWLEDEVKEERINELIGKMTGLEELQFYNLTGEMDLSPLENIIGLKKISLSFLYGEPDTRPLAKLQQLEEIYIEGGADEIDYAFLKELNNVKKISINRNGIEDLSFFAHMEKLEELDLHSVFTADFQQLEKLKKLRSLELYAVRLENIDCLGNLPNLFNLKVERDTLFDKDPIDLEFLKGLKSLDSLTLININAQSIEPVGELPLTFLSLSKVMNTESRLELEPIGKIKTLEYLHLENMALDSMEPLSKLYSLETLMLDNVDVQNIEPLKELAELKYLRISGQVSEQVKEQAKLYFSHVKDVEIKE